MVPSGEIFMLVMIYGDAKGKKGALVGDFPNECSLVVLSDERPTRKTKTTIIQNTC